MHEGIQATEQSNRQRSAVERAMMTERGMETYVEMLNITPSDFASWQRIVDLGSGTQQEFARAMKERYPEKNVFSVDARLLLSEEEDLAGMLPEEATARRVGRDLRMENTIAAYAHDLPLPDNSIDCVLASFSIPMYAETQEDLYSALDEIYRILRMNGEARLFPVQSCKNLYEVLMWLDRMEALGRITYEFFKKEEIKKVDEKYLIILKKIQQED